MILFSALLPISALFLITAPLSNVFLLISTPILISAPFCYKPRIRSLRYFICEIFGKTCYSKVIKLCMGTPCWCPFEGHNYGCRKPKKTSVFWVFLLMNFTRLNPGLKFKPSIEGRGPNLQGVESINKRLFSRKEIRSIHSNLYEAVMDTLGECFTDRPFTTQVN